MIYLCEVSLTVLVADDSPVARHAVTRRLRAEGYEVVEIGSAAAAPRPGQRVDVACALLDLDLGDGDGRDVARALRAARPDLPIAFFSASSAEDVVTDARRLGPVFTKPSQLDAAIDWVLGATRRDAP